MRMTIKKELLIGQDFMRGEKALAVIKDNEILIIKRLDEYTTHDDNQEILDTWKKSDGFVHHVQFLNKTDISVSFPLDIN